MGRLVVTEFVSLDGVMEAPGGEPGYKHSGWVGRFADTGQFEYKLDEVLAHEALLLGRKTYESFADAWPERDGVFADKMNEMSKFIASTTLENPAWNNTTVLEGDTAEAVVKLKDEIGGDLLVAGSRTLIKTLRQHDLVDEYRLMIFPIILGSGMRLFDEVPDATTLELIDMQRFGDGPVVLAYETVRATAGGRDRISLRRRVVLFEPGLRDAFRCPRQPRVDDRFPQLVAIDAREIRDAHEDSGVATKMGRGEVHAAIVGEQHVLRVQVADSEHQDVREPLARLRIDRVRTTFTMKAERLAVDVIRRPTVCGDLLRRLRHRKRQLVEIRHRRHSLSLPAPTS